MRSYLGKGNHMSERITGHTELIGLMAYPIRHSSSPAMQNEAFAKLGYDYAYLAFEVDANEIEAGVQALRTLKMRGANISMPNKTLVGKYLISPIGKKMTIVGCGGAGTAIQIQAALDGVSEISIFNRKDDFYRRGEETVQKINSQTSCKATLYDLADLQKLKEEMDDSYLFVNATGVGMKPLEGQSVVPDKSYFRPELNVVKWQKRRVAKR